MRQQGLDNGAQKHGAILVRGVQNSKKLDSELALWVFPLDNMSGVTTKNFSLLAYLEDPALAKFKIQRNFEKIQRKNQKVAFFYFSVSKQLL